MTPARFIDEMLRAIRAEFFAGHTDKRFFQERADLIDAVTWPARWMNERGVKAPASLYRRIIQTVIDTIRRKGNRAKIRRFSMYFLHCVQEHMKHHGDEYYYQAKAARPIADVLQAAARRVHNSGFKTPPHPTWCHCQRCDPTAQLAELNAIVKSPGGRRRRIQSDQQDLFARSSRLPGLRKREAAGSSA
jgi:hypothetical protein